jgi:hypothetical protein
MPRRKAVDNARLNVPRHFGPTPQQQGPRPPPPGTNTVTLTRVHHINGKSYGPGTLTVKTDIAAVLADQESRSRQEFASQFLATPASALIRPGGIKMPVAAHHFDQALLASEPIIIIDQNGIRR